MLIITNMCNLWHSTVVILFCKVTCPKTKNDVTQGWIQDKTENDHCKRKKHKQTIMDKCGFSSLHVYPCKSKLALNLIILK